MKISLLLTLPFFLFACAQGNCRSQVGYNESNKMTDKSKAPSVQGRIKVFKYDGSLQCGMGKAISLDEMAQQLKGLTVYSQENKSDGLMHIQQCGTNTGKANIYEIDKDKFVDAQKAGFKEWLWD